MRKSLCNKCNVNKKIFAFTIYVFSSTPHPLSRRTNRKRELLLSMHFLERMVGGRWRRQRSKKEMSCGMFM